MVIKNIPFPKLYVFSTNSAPQKKKASFKQIFKIALNCLQNYYNSWENKRKAYCRVRFSWKIPFSPPEFSVLSSQSFESQNRIVMRPFFLLLSLSFVFGFWFLNPVSWFLISGSWILIPWLCALCSSSSSFLQKSQLNLIFGFSSSTANCFPTARQSNDFAPNRGGGGEATKAKQQF